MSWVKDLWAKFIAALDTAGTIDPPDLSGRKNQVIYDLMELPKPERIEALREIFTNHMCAYCAELSPCGCMEKIPCWQKDDL